MGFQCTKSLSMSGVALRSIFAIVTSLATNGCHWTALVSQSSEGVQGNGSSYNAIISNNGRYVAFRSSATNLVSGDTNGHDDVFVHDVQTAPPIQLEYTSIAKAAIRIVARLLFLLVSIVSF